MRSWILDELHNLFGDVNVYMYHTEPTGLVCDKIIFSDDPTVFGRKRYNLIASEMCDCLGFMKCNSCKHLRMLGSEEEWPVTGVPGYIAIEETRHLREILAKYFNLSDVEIDEDMIATMTIRVVEITVPQKTEIQRLTAIKKTPEGSYGICIKLS